VRCESTLRGGWDAWSENVSAHGGALTSPLRIEISSRLRLSFTLPTGQTTPIDAVVQWMREFPLLMGVRLEGADPAYAQFLSSPGARIAPGIFVPDIGQSGSALAPEGTDWEGRLPARLLDAALRPAENTRLARYGDELPIRFGTGAGQVRRGFTTDLSPQGLGLSAREIPPIGAVVWVDITLPDSRLARVEGVMTWLRSVPAHGLEIGGLKVQRADEPFYQLVLDRQRAAAAGLSRLR